VRHVHAHHLGSELRVLEDLVGRHDARLDDLLAVVDVVYEAVERGHALHQALFHAVPLVRGDDTGNQVERNEALGAGTVLVLGAVHRKGDADAPEDHLGFFTPRRHDLFGLLGKPAGVILIVGPDLAGRGVHFVKHRSAHGLFLLTPA
jgi:hypothetical protein